MPIYISYRIARYWRRHFTGHRYTAVISLAPVLSSIAGWLA